MENTKEGYLPTQIPVKKAITFFMVPFFIKDDADICPSENSLWKRYEITVDKGILYAHIQNFLLASVRPDENGKLPPLENLQPHDYCIFSLDENMDVPIAAMMQKEMRWAILGKKGEDGNSFLSFRFMHSKEDKNLLTSPKLVICKNAKVGLIMFAAEMIIHKNSSLADLQRLNYRLFKTYNEESSQTEFVYLIPQAELIPLKLELETLTQKKKNIQRSIEKIQKRLEGKTNAGNEQVEQDQANLNLKREQLEELRINYEKREAEYVKLRNQKMTDSIQGKLQAIDQALGRSTQETYSLEERATRMWTMRELVQALTREFVDGNGAATIERVDPFRLHLLTYVQVEQPRTKKLRQRLIVDFTRILRCQDSDYQPVINGSGGTILEPLFDNIIVGSTVEGAGILTLLTGEGDDFMTNFDTTGLTKSYLWIYLMVFMQRLTLLRMSRLLADSFGHSEKKLDERIQELDELSRKMIQNKVNTFFTDVSNHSHHNAFYYLCSRNLAIENYQKDIDSKLKLLHDKMMEAYQEADKRNDEAAEWRGRRVDVIFAACAIVLALSSSCYDLLNLLSDDTSRGLGLFPDCMGGWRIVPVIGILTILMFSLYKFATRYLNKENRRNR